MDNVDTASPPSLKTTMAGLEDSATLILNALGCQNIKEDVLELDVLSNFYQAVATSYGRHTDGVHEALLTLKLIGGEDAKAISAAAFKIFICTRFNEQEDAISRLAAVATTFDFSGGRNTLNTINNTSDALSSLSPQKKPRDAYNVDTKNHLEDDSIKIEINNNVNQPNSSSYNNANNDDNAILLSHYQISNVKKMLERKISRRSSVAELVDRNVLKSPRMSRIDARTASIELKLRKATLAKALAKRLIEDEMVSYKINNNGIVKKRQSILEPLYSPRLVKVGSHSSGSYAKQRDNVNKQGLVVDSVSGGINRA